MNHIILIVEIVAAFSMLAAAKKLFGKAGIMAWIAIATVFANIFEAKNMMLFGLNLAARQIRHARDHDHRARHRRPRIPGPSVCRIRLYRFRSGKGP